MKFTGQFRSIIENNLYTVEIITNNDSSQTTEITLGPEPFITEMDQSADTIYTPIKYSKATVQIVADEYFTDMYSSTASSNKVTLYDASSNVVWTGYTTPNIFSAPFEQQTETYDIEAYDGLSTLRYYDYEVVDTSTGKDFVSFWNIIDKILAKAGCYNGFRFSKNTKVPGSSYCIIADLIISEQNFFDEDETPMKMNQVLEEICKFCGVTALAYGNFVYFIDYDDVKYRAQRNESQPYQTYQIGSMYNSEYPMSRGYSITSTSYRDSGGTLTMDNTYNKVTVKDSLYTVDSILPSLYDSESLTNVYAPNHKYASSTGKNDGKYWAWCYMSYRNSNYNHIYYNNNKTVYSGEPVFNGLVAESYLGAGIMRYCVKTSDVSDTDAYNQLKWKDTTNYLLITVNGINGWDNNGELPVLESKNNYSKPFFMSSNAKFIFQGSMILQDNNGRLYNQSGGTANYGYAPLIGKESGFQRNFWGGSSLEITKNTLRMKMKVQLGDKYYNGSSWTTTNSTFTIPFYTGNGTDKLYEDKKHDEIFYTEHNIKDNSSSTDTESGYIINLSGMGSNKAIPAKPKFTFYTFNPLTFSNTLYTVWIKDFDVKGIVPVTTEVDENETDTIYTNEIDATYVKELSDIEFKICTWDNKMLNYSAPVYVSNGDYVFLDKLSNTAMNLTERSENQLINRIVNQYKDPGIKLELTLRSNYIRPWSAIYENDNMAGKVMIVDSMSVNYRYDRATFNLVEKK